MCRMFAKYCVYSVYVVLIYMRVTDGQTGPDFAMVKKGLTYFPVLNIPQDALNIDLTSNNIEQIDADDFRGFNQLQKIVLADNILRKVPDLREVAETLLYLDFSKNSQIQFGKEAFEGLNALQELILANNKLTTLPNLSAIANNLVNLDLSKNDFGQIDPDYFKGFNSLQRLVLKQTQLTTLPDFSPIGTTLLYLDMDGNKLAKNFSTDMIKMLNVLEYIDIDRNKLTDFPAFNVMPFGFNLKSISIYDNEIKGIIPEQSLNGLVSLEDVRFRTNYITEFPNFRECAASLKTINLRTNKIRYIPVGTLDGFTALESLDLGSNQLIEFYGASCRATYSLTSLQLSDNELTTFPILSSMAVNLQLLRIMKNPITEITPESFIFLNRNQSVSLTIEVSDTLVETLPPIVGPNLDNLTIWVSNAPLVCDVRMAWLVVLPETRKAALEGECHMPPVLQGLQIKYLTFEDLEMSQGQEKSERKYIYSFAKLLVKDEYSNTLPMVRVFTSLIEECVCLCVRVQGCLYVNHYENIQDVNEKVSEGNCHYAAPYEGIMLDKPDNGTGWKYFYLDTV